MTKTTRYYARRALGLAGSWLRRLEQTLDEPWPSTKGMTFVKDCKYDTLLFRDEEGKGWWVSKTTNKVTGQFVELVGDYETGTLRQVVLP